ncbi:MAG: hypothetical protein ABG776_04910 [Cyanobacteria bacterium J06555_13]
MSGIRRKRKLDEKSYGPSPIRMKIWIRCNYLFPQRLQLKEQLDYWRICLTGNRDKLISIRKFHRILDESLIALPYTLILDGKLLGKAVFIQPYTRRAFARLMACESEPDLLSFADESWQFCDAGIQVLERIVSRRKLADKDCRNSPDSPPVSNKHAA